MASTPRPLSGRLRMYNVGFGDCFLLSFTYPGGKKRHLLIDFGTMSGPGGKKALSPEAIAADIAAETRGDPLAVIATHRHRDHISGFDDSTPTSSGTVIRKLRPVLVVQPWTEAPDAPKNARAPALDAAEKAFTRTLLSAHAVADSLAKAAAPGGRLGAKQAEEIRIIGADNLANRAAVRNLATMAAAHEYLCAGQRSAGLERAFPGVGFTILGPATPRQYPEIARQRARDAQEYWMLQARANVPAAAKGALDFPVLRETRERPRPPRLRWITRQMDAARGHQLLGIVRSLDTAMNNTSLIVLMKVGRLRLLFPGDAQGESWAYVLKVSPDAAQNVRELGQVDLYKVGHHGSRNATPKTLWAAFLKKKGRALVTAMSTKSGVHGRSAATKVPRATLVAALKKGSRLKATVDDRGKSINKPWIDIPLRLR